MGDLSWRLATGLEDWRPAGKSVETWKQEAATELWYSTGTEDRWNTGTDCQLWTSSTCCLDCRPGTSNTSGPDLQMGTRNKSRPDWLRGTRRRSQLGCRLGPWNWGRSGHQLRTRKQIGWMQAGQSECCRPACWERAGCALTCWKLASWEADWGAEVLRKPVNHTVDKLLTQGLQRTAPRVPQTELPLCVHDRRPPSQIFQAQKGRKVVCFTKLGVYWLHDRPVCTFQLRRTKCRQNRQQWLIDIDRQTVRQTCRVKGQGSGDRGLRYAKQKTHINNVGKCGQLLWDGLTHSVKVLCVEMCPHFKIVFGNHGRPVLRANEEKGTNQVATARGQPPGWYGVY